jgi:hypothetical protein
VEAFGHTSSPSRLVAKLLYGTGLRFVLCKGSLTRGAFGGADQILQQPNFSAQLSEALTRAGYDTRMGSKLLNHTNAKTIMIEGGYGDAYGHMGKTPEHLYLGPLPSGRDITPERWATHRCSASSSTAGACERKLASSCLPSRVKIDSG